MVCKKMSKDPHNRFNMSVASTVATFANKLVDF